MDLQLIRKDIDKIDKEIVELFEKRMKLTYDVAAFKIETGKKVYDKQRLYRPTRTNGTLCKGDGTPGTYSHP